jgi:hypothetical protein
MGKTKHFNQHIKLYLKTLILEFPQVSQLNLIYTAFKTGKTINKRIPMFAFKRFMCEPYGKMIQERNPFFMEDTFVFKEIIFAIVHDSIKEEWIKLDIEEQNKHWDQLITLMDICGAHETKIPTETETTRSLLVIINILIAKFVCKPF